MTLYSEEGGDGTDLIVLLHGLGATGAVWKPLLEVIRTQPRWRWFVPDLLGHGKSPWAARYSVEQNAAAIGDALKSRAQSTELHVATAGGPPGSSGKAAGSSGRLVVLGHSLGGAVALALASGQFGVQPDAVFGVGIKLAWSDEDVKRMQSLAMQPAKQFPTQAEALTRYLKVAGLFDLVSPESLLASADSSVAARGIISSGDHWKLSMDPRANDVGSPAFAELAAAARCPLHLARGGRDSLVTLDQTRRLDPEAVDLGSYGHNVMVEAPEVLWAWVARNPSTLFTLSHITPA